MSNMEDNKLIQISSSQDASSDDNDSNDKFIVESKKNKSNNVIFDSQLLTSLQKCPRYYNYQFNHNRRPIGGKSNALECGSIVHTILEEFYKSLRNGKNRNDAIDNGYNAGKEYLLPYSEDNKYILDKNHKGVIQTPAEDSSKPKRIGYKHVFNTMNEYFDYYRSENITPLYIEEVFGKLLYEDEEIKIIYKAKYDLIEMNRQIGELPTDHKTMSQVRNTISLNNQFIGQCIIRNVRRMQVNKIGFQTSLKAEEKFLRPLMTYSLDRLTEWQNEIVPYYARMLLAYNEAGYFPPNFSQCEDKYGYCNYKKVCEHDRNSREEVLKREYELVDKWDIGGDTE